MTDLSEVFSATVVAYNNLLNESGLIYAAMY